MCHLLTADSVQAFFKVELRDSDNGQLKKSEEISDA